MKKVIFIGGTSRSGTTLLDLILANDSRAKSLGEIVNIFNPTRKHHFKEVEKLKSDSKWSEIIEKKVKNLYPTLLEYFPEIDFFVDSSKDPFWYKKHLDHKRRGYEIKKVIIYKTPVELAKSFMKRDQEKKWIKQYIYRHKLYFRIFDDFVSIPYKDLIVNEKVLEKLCEHLGIKYYEAKRRYWENQYSTFFGSNSVRQANSQDANRQLNKITREGLSYTSVKNESVIQFVSKIKQRNPELNEIEEALNDKSILNDSEKKSSSSLRINNLVYSLIYLRRLFKMKFRYFFPEDYFG